MWADIYFHIDFYKFNKNVLLKAKSKEMVNDI